MPDSGDALLSKHHIVGIVCAVVSTVWLIVTLLQWRKHGDDFVMTAIFTGITLVLWLLLGTLIFSNWRVERKARHGDTKQGKPQPKLKIHRATWGGGPQGEVSVTEELQNCPREALVIRVDHDLGGLTHDPAFAVQKRLEIDYSYGSDTLIHVSRLEPPAGEIMRLVLPEDTEVARIGEDTAREWNVKFQAVVGQLKDAQEKLEEAQSQIPLSAYDNDKPMFALRKRVLTLGIDLFGLLREKGPAPEDPHDHMRTLDEVWQRYTDKWWKGYRIPLDAAYQLRFRQRVKDMLHELTEHNIKNNIAAEKVNRDDVEPRDILDLAQDIVETAANMDVIHLSEGT